MSDRILTLFGEEIVPEQPKAVAKTRAKKTTEEKPLKERIKKNKPAEEQPEPEIQETAAAGEESNDLKINDEEQQLPPEKKQPKIHVNLPDDWDGEKKYYTIGEVATLFKVKTSHIRFWTNEFKLKVRTTRKGDRLFTAEQIKELRGIHHLVKERGFTLSGAKAKLKTQNKIDIESIDLKESLLQLRSKLTTIRNQLT